MRMNVICIFCTFYFVLGYSQLTTTGLSCTYTCIYSSPITPSHPGCVGSRVRHYWQNGGMALNPLPFFHRHGPGIKELGFMILTWFFLSLAELTKENIKVLIVFERSMKRHKAFCSCAQRIIHKVNHWHLFKDICRRVFQGEHRGRSLRPWEGFLSEAHLWEKFMAKEFAELRA